MPDPQTFINEFGIKKGNYFGYNLTEINVSHKTIIPYKEYIYYIALEYEIVDPKVNVENFYNMHQFSPLIINSNYGNPYNCYLNKRNYTFDNKKLTIVLEGKSYRV